MRKLIIYPNFSMGGVTSVIRGRAAAEPRTKFDVIFFKERGGDGAFDDFSNVEVRVCNENRIENFINNRLDSVSYDEISVLSHPKIANTIAQRFEAAVTYEFHSSDMEVIEAELAKLNLADLASIAAPSVSMVEKIMALLPNRYKPRMTVIPNLVDSTVFVEDGPATFLSGSFILDSDEIPLVWVGRFDMGKGYRYFLRLLAKLPEKYVGIAVVSLEENPDRPTKFLSEGNAMGVGSRVRMFSNLSRRDMANLYRSARNRRGWLVSTSLMESFGYSIAESLACELRVAAFELPALLAFSDSAFMNMVDIGSVSELAALISADVD